MWQSMSRASFCSLLLLRMSGRHVEKTPPYFLFVLYCSHPSSQPHWFGRGLWHGLGLLTVRILMKPELLNRNGPKWIHTVLNRSGLSLAVLKWLGPKVLSPEMLRKHAGFRACGREDAQICRGKLQALRRTAFFRWWRLVNGMSSLVCWWRFCLE